jgi:hypothetical protein
MRSTYHRKFYSNDGGDSWWLCKEQCGLFVLHERDNGEMISKRELDRFLADPRFTPEKQALVNIIGSLAQLDEGFR